ncbi:MAG: glycoside hydrolase family 97 protein [Tenuifilaceae bacterium]
MRKLLTLIALCTSILIGCNSLIDEQKSVSIKSPSRNISVDFMLLKEGISAYKISFDNKVVIDNSTLGFEFKNAPSLNKNLKIISIDTSEYTETWEMPWGEQRYVKNNYKELKIKLKERNQLNREFYVAFRVFDDGVGFRYEFPDQQNMKDVIITDENTQFKLTGDHLCWWNPGDWDIYEHLYKTTNLSKIDAIKNKSKNELAQTYIPENAVNTPFTMKTKDGIYLSFHEADVTNYAGMTLKVDTTSFTLQSELVGYKSGNKVYIQTPFNTPWRTILVAKNAGDLIESKLMLNLNEPNKIGDVSYFKPMKYVGIWWEMHLNKSTWAKEGGKHGATTENAKKYIDFAAANNIGGLLVEGWNTGWERWIGFDDREGIFDFVTPYSDYNLQEVVDYANKKGVKLIMHHETSAAPRTYEKQMDTAFALMQKLNIHSVKTGYVGKIIPDSLYHQGQWMVNHYRKVIETAAKYKIAVNAHEPFKGTGEWRTYPNVISREDFRGQEFNAWSIDGGNPPEHLTILPFTAGLAGPMDYTPGIFNIKLKPYKKDNQVNTTLAHQLALYVVIYSPIQMAADLPENYIGHSAFQFIRDVGVDWDTTIVLNGEIGDYLTIARKERGTDKWFIGSVTDENSRETSIILDFLDENKTYSVNLYLDGENAHWDKNPTEYRIERRTNIKGDILTLKMAGGGGAALSLIPK